MTKSFDNEIWQLSINENELLPDVEISRRSSSVDFYKLFVTNELNESVLKQILL